MKKAIKYFVCMLGIISIAAALFFCFAFFGNPVSKLICKHSAKEYIRKNHPDYKIETVKYNFKDGNYFARVYKEGSVDSKFHFNMDWKGDVLYSGYESYVTGKHNTQSRVRNEYDRLVEAALENTGYNIELIGARILDYENYDTVLWNTDNVCMPREEYVLDKQYDYKCLSSQYGYVSLWVYEDEVSYELAADILLKVKEILDEQNITPYYFELELRLKSDAKNDEPPQTISTPLIKSSDIYPEGLEQRIETAHRDLRDYFDYLDTVSK